MCMQLRKNLESFLSPIVCTEPSVSRLARHGPLNRRYHPPGRLRKEHDQATQEDGWNQLTTQRDAPFSAVPSVCPGHVAAVTDPRCENLTKGIEELLQACDLASDLAMRQFGLIDGDDHGQEAYADASDEAADIEHSNDYSSSLNGTTDNEDATCEQDRTPSA